MPLYLDTSALAKRYLPEGISSQTVRRILSRSTDWGGLIVSAMVGPEVISAFATTIRANSIPLQRREAISRLPAVITAFRRELGSGLLRILPVNDLILDDAARLIAANPMLNIGAADAIHLATAMEVREELGSELSLVFVTADRGLAEAAQQERFVVFDPLYDRAEKLHALPGLHPSR
jgi:predicted nucleic acid-binding protein